MHTRPGTAPRIAWRGLIATLAIATIGNTIGCAELARSAPALTLEGRASERTAARSGGGAERGSNGWSWSVGARLSGRWGAAARPVREDVASRPLPVRAGSRCRIPAACAWEARARLRALTRMRALVEAGR